MKLKRMNIFITLLIIFLYFPTRVWCDLKEELNTFFDSYNTSVNVNSAEIYEGQKAGYATGGGVVLRNRVMNTPVATVNLPRFDAGCGGIDIYTGGFSFINDKQLINTLKSIGTSAAGYAFLLGLETVSPQICNTIKQLQSWSNMINGTSINSCEMATQLVGSVWPRNSTASQHICRSVGTHKMLFSNYLAARHDCSSQQTQKQVNNEAKELGLITDEYNIAWEAFQKHPSISQNNDLAELFMTLMGTIILKREEVPQVIHYPSKITDESFLRVLLEGGQTSIYSCSEKKHCLTIKDSPLKIDPSQGWVGRTRSILLNIQEKILKDEELDASEREFIAKSHLPLYRIVNVLTAYKKGCCAIDLYQIADIVAMDMLVQYLREAVELVRQGCQQLRQAQLYAAEVDDYLIELQRIEEIVRRYEMRSLELMQREMHIIQKIQMIEEQIAAEITLY